jgi:hypothetical protein
MKAKMQIKIVDSRTNRWELRAGEKGTGQVLAAGTYWPDSDKSVEMRDRQISEICRRDGIEIVGD